MKSRITAIILLIVTSFLLSGCALSDWLIKGLGNLRYERHSTSNLYYGCDSCRNY